MGRDRAPTKRFSVQEVAGGIGVKPTRIYSWLHRLGARKPGNRWLLTSRQVWGLISAIRLQPEGFWYGLTSIQQDSLLGPRPDLFREIPGNPNKTH